jgi:hypothetical protein
MTKILIKEVDKFMREQWSVYHKCDRVSFMISLHAAPGKKRYCVRNEKTGMVRDFTKIGDAVRCANFILGEA